MAEKKSHEVDAWLARPDPKIAIALIYGPDRGLVAERAKLFAAKSGVPMDDAFSVVRLDAGEVERDPVGWRTSPAPSRGSRRAG